MIIPRKDEENKIVREALADFLAGKTESTAIAAFEEYNATVARLKASAKEECCVEYTKTEENV